MTAKTLMFEDTVGGVLYRSEKQPSRFRDRVRTQRFKNDEIRRNKISQIVHSDHVVRVFASLYSDALYISMI